MSYQRNHFEPGLGILLGDRIAGVDRMLAVVQLVVRSGHRMEPAVDSLAPDIQPVAGKPVAAAADQESRSLAQQEQQHHTLVCSVLVRHLQYLLQRRNRKLVQRTPSSSLQLLGLVRPPVYHHIVVHLLVHTALGLGNPVGDIPVGWP